MEGRWVGLEMLLCNRFCWLGMKAPVINWVKRTWIDEIIYFKTQLMKCYVFVVKHLNGGPVRCLKTPCNCWSLQYTWHIIRWNLSTCRLLQVTNFKTLNMLRTKFKEVKHIIFRPLLPMFNLLLLAVGNISFRLPHRLSLAPSPSWVVPPFQL